MPTAAVNGLELYYEEHGAGEPLLCVMGLGGDVSAWAGQVPLWSSAYRMVTFDHRDVGRSTYVSEGYGITDLADDALALADALGLERFHLVGVSMGGAVAQELALRAPARVRTLTLGVSFARADRWMRERARLTEAGLAVRSDADILDELLLLTWSAAKVEHENHMRYLRRLIADYPYAQRQDGFVRQLRASVTHDAGDRLASLAMPVLVVGAEQDLMVPVWRSRELAQLIPDAELTVLEGAAHAVTLERAQEFAEIVHEFVQRRS